MHDDKENLKDSKNDYLSIEQSNGEASTSSILTESENIKPQETQKWNLSFLPSRWTTMDLVCYLNTGLSFGQGNLSKLNQERLSYAKKIALNLINPKNHQRLTLEEVRTYIVPLASCIEPEIYERLYASFYKLVKEDPFKNSDLTLAFYEILRRGMMSQCMGASLPKSENDNSEDPQPNLNLDSMLEITLDTLLSEEMSTYREDRIYDLLVLCVGILDVMYYIGHHMNSDTCNKYKERIKQVEEDYTSYDIKFLSEYAYESLHYLKEPKEKSLKENIQQAIKIFKGVKSIVSGLEDLFGHIKDFKLTKVVKDFKDIFGTTKELFSGPYKEFQHRLSITWYEAIQNVRFFLEWGNVEILEQLCKVAQVNKVNMVELLARQLGVLSNDTIRLYCRKNKPGLWKECKVSDKQLEVDSYIFIQKEEKLFYINENYEGTKLHIHNLDKFTSLVNEIMGKEEFRVLSKEEAQKLKLESRQPKQSKSPLTITKIAKGEILDVLPIEEIANKTVTICKRYLSKGKVNVAMKFLYGLIASIERGIEDTDPKVKFVSCYLLSSCADLLMRMSEQSLEKRESEKLRYQKRLNTLLTKRYFLYDSKNELFQSMKVDLEKGKKELDNLLSEKKKSRSLREISKKTTECFDQLKREIEEKSPISLTYLVRALNDVIQAFEEKTKKTLIQSHKEKQLNKCLQLFKEIQAKLTKAGIENQSVALTFGGFSRELEELHNALKKQYENDETSGEPEEILKAFKCLEGYVRIEQKGEWLDEKGALKFELQQSIQVISTYLNREQLFLSLEKRIAIAQRLCHLKDHIKVLLRDDQGEQYKFLEDQINQLEKWLQENNSTQRPDSTLSPSKIFKKIKMIGKMAWGISVTPPEVLSRPLGNKIYKGSSGEHPLMLSYKKDCPLELCLEQLYDPEKTTGKKGSYLSNQLDLYIPSKGTKIFGSESKTNLDLWDTFIQFRENPQQSMWFMQGSAGSGKSLFLRYLERCCWEEYYSGNSNVCIPLYIALSEIKDLQQDIVRQALEMRGFSPDVIRRLKEQDHLVVLFLDGYDEIKHDINLLSKVDYDNWKNGDNIKLVVTSRPGRLNFLNYTTECEQYSKSILVHSLNPFDKSDKEKYIQKVLQQELDRQGNSNSENQKKLKKEIKKYVNYLESYPTLKDLSNNPFLLSMLIKVRDVFLGQNLTKSIIFEKFIEFWIENERKHFKQRKEVPENYDYERSVLNYIEDLAFQMWLSGCTSVKAKNPQYQKIKKKTDHWSHFFPSLQDNRNTYLARKFAPLKQEGIEVSFVHKSILEYAIAKIFAYEINRMIQVMDKLKAEDKEEVLKTYLEKHCFGKKCLHKDPEILEFLGEMLNKEEHANVLLKIVRLSSHFPVYNENFSFLTCAASNAMMILQALNYNFSGEDFSNIQIPNAVLDGGNFHGTKFIGANLAGVRLIGAYLGEVDFTGANLQDVEFGELVGCSFQSEHFNKIIINALSPDGTKALTIDEIGCIAVWDVSLQQLLLTSNLRVPYPGEKYHSSDFFIDFNEQQMAWVVYTQKSSEIRWYDCKKSNSKEELFSDLIEQIKTEEKLVRWLEALLKSGYRYVIGDPHKDKGLLRIINTKMSKETNKVFHVDSKFFLAFFEKCFSVPFPKDLGEGFCFLPDGEHIVGVKRIALKTQQTSLEPEISRTLHAQSSDPEKMQLTYTSPPEETSKSIQYSLWRMSGKEEIKKVSVETDKEFSLSLNHDAYLYISSNTSSWTMLIGDKLFLLRFSENKIQFISSHHMYSPILLYTPEQTDLLVLRGDKIFTISTSTGEQKEIENFESTKRKHDTSFSHLLYSSDNNWLVAATSTGHIVLWGKNFVKVQDFWLPSNKLNTLQFLDTSLAIITKGYLSRYSLEVTQVKYHMSRHQLPIQKILALSNEVILTEDKFQNKRMLWDEKGYIRDLNSQDFFVQYGGKPGLIRQQKETHKNHVYVIEHIETGEILKELSLEESIEYVSYQGNKFLMKIDPKSNNLYQSYLLIDTEKEKSFKWDFEEYFKKAGHIKEDESISNISVVSHPNCSFFILGVKVNKILSHSDPFPRTGDLKVMTLSFENEIICMKETIKDIEDFQMEISVDGSHLFMLSKKEKLGFYETYILDIWQRNDDQWKLLQGKELKTYGVVHLIPHPQNPSQFFLTAEDLSETTGIWEWTSEGFKVRQIPLFKKTEILNEKDILIYFTDQCVGWFDVNDLTKLNFYLSDYSSETLKKTFEELKTHSQIWCEKDILEIVKDGVPQKIGLPMTTSTRLFLPVKQGNGLIVTSDNGIAYFNRSNKKEPYFLCWDEGDVLVLYGVKFDRAKGLTQNQIQLLKQRGSYLNSEPILELPDEKDTVVSVELKSLLGFLKEEKFYFKLFRPSSYKIVISLINSNEILMTNEDIRKWLVGLGKKLKEDLISIGLTSEQYGIQVNWEKIELTITSDVAIMKRIGEILYTAGIPYWKQEELGSYKKFFSGNSGKETDDENQNEKFCLVQ